MSENNPTTLHWFLPTYGDSRGITAGGHGFGFHSGSRTADLDYLSQIALAAERNGFESVLTPTGLWCEDAWITTAALLSRTSKLKFLVAIRPGQVSPTIIAQQGAAFQKFSNNRLLINVVVGGEDHEQRAFADYSSKEERYHKADETLEIIDHLWNSAEPLNFQGEFLSVENAVLKEQPEVSPPIYFGGSSQLGIEIAAQHSDVYLTWGEPAEKVEEKLARVRAEADKRNRELDYGIRLHVIARPTEDEAWSVAQNLLDQLDQEEVARIQEGLARSQSEGQRRMTELHGQGAAFTAGADARSLEIAPNLWAGVGLVRGGAGTALVGSYEQVAQAILRYRDIGLSHFIFSGYPHLEETYHVGEGVVPELLKLGVPVNNHEEQRNDVVATPFISR
ncbi:FMNH2-dependent aliphatic sulfonate monooxygenase [Corynebacterium glutamicum MB001]|uniref:Coenzyme F420-dependent N5,N10-methylene tetrahydromethanopterin reductase and related flavin-dependent oxidoreductases n=1 Tax=Corynebacterium glutamicum (strain ATCC 13032 / DSM 20300 / JCM 1318 / BCRC 11384 / CCUG 27702 / LMG 3730 / NBRC 12168 / NCIMB 10025 / NRRL B-2784 / 534) TaxID=196627 RepID=Q8NRN0_CORGL|nr:LLM class flavin-dependent oxidoreductase [Corynebacterium glutamicum]AGT05012.1 FMNH2-dependent aliphatic sulfonate monooxygenase [Corynebacterium glutamicum MB001]AIK84715.1 alkanesulfonate monooxygenase [Corynebacterium glutamicum]AIK87499.1 alkanesulfonate monooxygenase [Corynebacterium glutamicum]ASW13707.1 FMNH2-dependent aliphatic sulfonate monooxygenase [Corynebacterium glutamicum]AUI00565.1 alkanesulfonate monooxygenase [Corynebacterium glutamicum]